MTAKLNTLNEQILRVREITKGKESDAENAKSEKSAAGEVNQVIVIDNDWLAERHHHRRHPPRDPMRTPTPSGPPPLMPQPPRPEPLREGAAASFSR